MSGNSNKPGGNKTVQTLLQAKKDKGKEKPPKRPITEVSMGVVVCWICQIYKMTWNS